MPKKFEFQPMRKKIGHRDCSRWAHGELTVTKMVTARRDWAVTWAVIELWPSRDWAVIILKMPWLSCDLAVTELWPSRDWAVTELWPLLAMTEPWSLGHRALTTVVTVSSPWAHGDHLFSHGKLLKGTRWVTWSVIDMLNLFRET